MSRNVEMPAVLPRTPPRRVHVAGGDWVIFGPPPSDHVQPELLDDPGLADAIETLQLKRRSAHVELAEAHLLGAFMSALVLGGALLVLFVGPAAVVQTLDDRRITTVWDLMIWWMVLAPASAAAGAYGIVTLGRRVREVRGWRHRASDLALRLKRARAERERRRSILP